MSVFVREIRIVGSKQPVGPMWKKLMEFVDLERTSFTDHVYLGCTHRECKSNETIVEMYGKVFESRVSAGATEIYQVAITRCGVRYCEFANRKVQGRRIGMLENCQKRALKLFSNVCTWHELVDLTFCSKLSRVITKWTRGCD